MSEQAAARVQEYVRVHASQPGRPDLVAWIDTTEDGGYVQIQVSDLQALLANQLTPEQEAVLRSSVAEYRAGHRSDRAAAKDPAVVYTPEDRTAYQRALYEHYQAVRAYIRANSQQAEEPAPDVRP